MEQATVTDWMDAALLRSPAQPLFRRRAARRLAVLAYHEVTDPQRLTRHLDYIAQHLHPVSHDVLLDALHGRRTLPRRAVFITFDDGHRSVLETALPLLRERGIPAAVYVIAGLLDTDQPFWWTEVETLARNGGTTRHAAAGTAPGDAVRTLKKLPDARRLAAIDELRRTARHPALRMPQLRRDELPALEAGGIAVGNHTLTHPCLGRCPEEKIRHELKASQQILTEALGHPPRTLAYPNGDEDPRVVQAAGCGFEAAFLFDHRLSENPPPNPLRISRLRVGCGASMGRFRLLLSGLHPALHRLRGGV